MLDHVACVSLGNARPCPGDLVDNICGGHFDRRISRRVIAQCRDEGSLGRTEAVGCADAEDSFMRASRLGGRAGTPLKSAQAQWKRPGGFRAGAKCDGRSRRPLPYGPPGLR